MSSSSPAFVVTREHQRFAEFCDACRSYRYIGLCYGTPGVGKTLSARDYARWDQIEACQAMHELPDRDLAAIQTCETVFYTPQVVHSPGQIERDLQQLRVRLRELRWEKLRREETDRLSELRERDSNRRQAHLLDQDWLSGELPSEVGSSEINYAQVIREYADRREEHRDPTQLIGLMKPTA